MKKTLLSIQLLSLILLTSCSSTIEGTMYISDASIKISWSNTLTSDSKITGTFTLNDGQAPKEYYVLGYTDKSIYSSTSTTETVLQKFTKGQLSQDNTINYEIKLNLNSMFPTKDKQRMLYFIFHSSEYSRSDIKTYSTSEYKYTWDGDKVKLNLE